MKIKLKSDFHDYYDHWFDDSSSSTTFTRLSTNGMSRPEMFNFFTHYNIPTPKYGLVKNLTNCYNVVVYEDLYLHRGEGKLKLAYHHAMEKYSDYFASKYLPPDNTVFQGIDSINIGISYRYLSVGNKNFWLKYTSLDNWKSNWGDVVIEILHDMEDGGNYYFELPLYAIDFIKHKDILYAIDFNISPQIKGTGLEFILPAKEVADGIREYEKRNNTKFNNTR
jgi:hypothetical protein